jgi:predicted RNase H-like nuclease (RuvC/YqgF family)
MYGGNNMQDITEILKTYEIEIPEEKKESFLKDFRNSYKSSAELEKLKDKNSNLEKTLNEYNTTIENYKKVDVEGLKNELKEWQDKYENANKEYTEKINKNLLEKEFSKFKFTSNTAKNSIFNQAFNSEKISFDGDKVNGIDDFIQVIKEQDPNAFVIEQEEEEKPKFTRGISSTNSKNLGDPSKMDFETYKKWRNSNN